MKIQNAEAGGSSVFLTVGDFTKLNILLKEFKNNLVQIQNETLWAGKLGSRPEPLDSTVCPPPQERGDVNIFLCHHILIDTENKW